MWTLSSNDDDFSNGSGCNGVHTDIKEGSSGVRTVWRYYLHVWDQRMGRVLGEYIGSRWSNEKGGPAEVPAHEVGQAWTASLSHARRAPEQAAQAETG
jgi:hypothetical protein